EVEMTGLILREVKTKWKSKQVYQFSLNMGS
ncbi:unnamed protein product, partial [marine sediment metagenome]